MILWGLSGAPERNFANLGWQSPNLTNLSVMVTPLEASGRNERQHHSAACCRRSES